MSDPSASPFSGAASFLAGFSGSELLNLLADGAYITDTDRQIVFWNQAAERITGWTGPEVVGRRCRDNLLVHVDKDGHELCGHEHCPLHRCIVTGQPSSEPMLVFAQHRTGLRIPVEVTVAPIRNHAGEVIGGIEMFRDLTASVQDQLRAREIQELAVRWEPPQDSRVSFETCYEPRDLVGGDFFRIEALDGDRYAILVADVRGHGVSAALFTVLLRSLWDELHPELGSPGRFLAKVNERLQAVVGDMGFIGTAALATYKAGSGEVRLVLAGHPSPLLFRSDGSSAPVGCRNPALGLPTLAACYNEARFQLLPGDALLLYTDGATELFDPADHELGWEGLQQLAHGLAPAGGTGFHLGDLEEKLLQFNNGIHLPDDLTMVKVGRLI